MNLNEPKCGRLDAHTIMGAARSDCYCFLNCTNAAKSNRTIARDFLFITFAVALTLHTRVIGT